VDNRFSSEFDQRTNYKTRTVLACPILERGRCIGVLQCVNKLSGHFTKDDEALLEILAEFSRTVLTNAMDHDE
jgi:GAF domain-containing protein